MGVATHIKCSRQAQYDACGCLASGVPHLDGATSYSRAHGQISTDRANCTVDSMAMLPQGFRFLDLTGSPVRVRMPSNREADHRVCYQRCQGQLRITVDSSGMLAAPSTS